MCVAHVCTMYGEDRVEKLTFKAISLYQVVVVVCVAHVCTMYGEGRAEKLTFKAISLYQVVVVVCVWLMCVQCMAKAEQRS